MQTFVERSRGGACCRAWVPSLLAVLVCANVVWAQTNPFEGVILTRNIFGLVPRPPPPEQPLPPLPKFTLTGITTVTGPARALMKMTPVAGTAGSAGERFFNLTVGERDGDLEVLEINEKSRSVVISYSGTRLTLGFEPEKPNATAPAVSMAPHVAVAAESAPPRLPGGFSAVAARGQEEMALLREATRADVQQKIQARVRLMRTGGPPLVGGE